jgi:hypothetical protein
MCFNVMTSSNISSSAQYVTLQKYFSHPGLLTHFFPTPPIKLKLGHTTISNTPGPIKLSSQSMAGVRLCCAFYQPVHPFNKCWAKTTLLIQGTCFHFSSSNFLLLGHILSIGGAALVSLLKQVH